MSDTLYDDSAIAADDECYSCDGRGALTHGDLFGGGDLTLIECSKCEGTGRKSKTGGKRYYATEANVQHSRVDMQAEIERLRQALSAVVIALAPLTAAKDNERYYKDTQVILRVAVEETEKALGWRG